MKREFDVLWRVFAKPDGTAYVYISDKLGSFGFGYPVLANVGNRSDVSLGKHALRISEFQWSPDNKRIAAIGLGTKGIDNGHWIFFSWLHLFDTESGEPLRRVRVGTQKVGGNSICWSPDSKRLAAGNDAGTCDVFDSGSLRLITSQKIHRLGVTAMTWHPSDDRIASSGADRTVAIWDATSGDILLRFDVDQVVKQLQWSPDGRILAARANGGDYYIWNASAGYGLADSHQMQNWLHDRLHSQYELSLRTQDYLRAKSTLVQLLKSQRDSSFTYYRAYQAGLLSAWSSDQEQFSDICHRMIEQFHRSLNDTESHFTAWTCALAPGALDDYEPAIQLARQAVEKNPDNQQYLGGLGAILLRAGKYEEAKEQLEKALEAGEDDNTSSSYIHYFLAMTEHHLGNIEAAKEQLRRANASSEKELEGSPSWNRRLTLALLRDEAKSLITGSETNADGSAK